jgi:hypothetical protein
VRGDALKIPVRARLAYRTRPLAPTAGGLQGLRRCSSAPGGSTVSNFAVSKSDNTSAPTLRNPEANDRRIAHVRSSLVGWKPPRIQGIETRARTATVPATSLTRNTFEPVTLATARTRIAVSTFAATSVRGRRALRPGTGRSASRKPRPCSVGTSPISPAWRKPKSTPGRRSGMPLGGRALDYV